MEGEYIKGKEEWEHYLNAFVGTIPAESFPIHH
jgi:hypothetical protein